MTTIAAAPTPPSWARLIAGSVAGGAVALLTYFAWSAARWPLPAAATFGGGMLVARLIDCRPQIRASRSAFAGNMIIWAATTALITWVVYLLR